jgi:hypothetical protein
VIVVALTAPLSRVIAFPITKMLVASMLPTPRRSVVVVLL